MAKNLCIYQNNKRFKNLFECIKNVVWVKSYHVTWYGQIEYAIPRYIKNTKNRLLMLIKRGTSKRGTPIPRNKNHVIKTWYGMGLSLYIRDNPYHVLNGRYFFYSL